VHQKTTSLWAANSLIMKTQGPVQNNGSGSKGFALEYTDVYFVHIYLQAIDS